MLRAFCGSWRSWARRRSEDDNVRNTRAVGQDCRQRNPQQYVQLLRSKDCSASSQMISIHVSISLALWCVHYSFRYLVNPLFHLLRRLATNTSRKSGDISTGTITSCDHFLLEYESAL